MGYTHYWYSPTSMEGEKFDQFAKSMQKLFVYASKMDIALDYKFHMNPTEEFPVRYIRFNGQEPFDYEDAFFAEKQYFPPWATEEEKEGGLVFNFCKTAHNPYDRIVLGAINLLKHYFPETELSSDGGELAIQSGKDLAEMILSS